MKEYYTVKETAKLLNVKPNTIYRWIKEGRLEATQKVFKGAIRIHYLEIPTNTREAKK